MKIIVAHSERQHSYMTATALKKNGALYKYVTSVYRKNKSLTNFVIKFLKGSTKERAINRVCPFIDEDDVAQICELEELILLFLVRFKSNDFGRRVYMFWENHISKKFGKKLAKYAIKENVDAIITYDTQAKYLGRYLKRKNSDIKLIMDVSAANLSYMKKIFEKDMIICPQFKDRLMKEMWRLWDDKYMSSQKEQLQYISNFLVPSTFVKKSLEDNAVDSKKISICPYGAYFSDKEIKERDYSGSRPVKIVYVGKVNVLKGSYYILEAMMRIPEEVASLTLVGSYDNFDGAFTKYFDRVNFVGSVIHDEVVEYLNDADVFIIASFGEGLSLAALEAMNMGLPVIVSKNAGVGDFIEEYYNGFVIPIQNIDEIVEKINWFANNRDKIKEMSDNVITTAKKLSWDNYYDNLYNVMKDILGTS